MNIGSYVKFKRKIGVVTDCYSDNTFGVVSHNGMKPRHYIESFATLIPISRNEFLTHCAKHGHTSMYQFLDLKP